MGNKSSQTLRLQIVVFAIYFGAAALLVMGHSLDDFHMPLMSDVPTISALHHDASVTVAWAPPQKKLELQALLPGRSLPLRLIENDEADIRPVWGMFVAIVGFFFFLSAHSNAIIHFTR